MAALLVLPRMRGTGEAGPADFCHVAELIHAPGVGAGAPADDERAVSDRGGHLARRPAPQGRLTAGTGPAGGARTAPAAAPAPPPPPPPPGGGGAPGGPGGGAFPG